MAEEEVLDAEHAAKNAKRFMVLTAFAVACAIIVLAIDMTIKNNIIIEAQKAQAILDEVRALAGEARNGAEAAGEAGSDSGAGVHHGDDVVHDAPAGEVLDQAANGASPAPRKRPVRAPRGPSGNDG